MSQYQALGLIFEPEADDPLARPPLARIYVQTFTTGVVNGFKEPVHCLTPMEYGPDQFDAHADRLIENITRLKKEARQRFARAAGRQNVS